VLAAFGTRAAFKRGEQRDRDVLLSDLFAGPPANIHAKLRRRAAHGRETPDVVLGRLIGAGE
jgi:hypothetical protein